MNANSGIELCKLSIGHGGKALLPPIDLTVPGGSLTVLVGANGAGKSTLLHTIGATLPAVSGRVLIDGEDVRAMSRKQLARKVALVYTERYTSGGLTVRELVGMGRHPYTGLFGRLSATDRAIVDEAMADTGISAKADNFVSDISDGERQKAMIARALAQQTPVILLDEPTNFLDVASRIEVMTLIKRLVTEKGLTALISTHDVSAALPLADNVLVLLPGDAEPAAVHPRDSEQTRARLERVFADRGIVFDSGTFRMKGE